VASVGGKRYFDKQGKIYLLYTGGFIGFVIILTIAEQMGMPNAAIGYTYMGITIGLYGVISLISRTAKISEYYVAGRAVPAFFERGRAQEPAQPQAQGDRPDRRFGAPLRARKGIVGDRRARAFARPAQAEHDRRPLRRGARAGVRVPDAPENSSPARSIHRGLGPDNFVDPDELSALERKTAREAFRLVTKVQRLVIDRYRASKW